MIARIFQPAKTAMQAGKALTDHWVLEFEAEAARRIDPLMGWTSADDTRAGQVHLTFDSKQAAIAFAEAHAISYQLAEPQKKTPVARAYSDNFSYQRRQPWTH